jgi:hypothetical protein
MHNYYDCLDVHGREVHSCESVFVAENDEGCDQRGRINSDHAGRIDAPARDPQRELRPGRKSHSRLGLRRFSWPVNSRALKPQAVAIDPYDFYRSWFKCPLPRSAICARHDSFPRRHFIRIQTAKVNAAKTATAPSRPKQRVRAQPAHGCSLAALARWRRRPRRTQTACAPSLCGTEPGCRAGSRARPKFRRKRVRAARRGQTKRSRACVRSSRSTRSRPLPTAAALRLPSTRRVTANWSRTFQSDERDAASPSADRLNWARCCARRRSMREGKN